MNQVNVAQRITRMQSGICSLATIVGKKRKGNESSEHGSKDNKDATWHLQPSNYSGQDGHTGSE